MEILNESMFKLPFLSYGIVQCSVSATHTSCADCSLWNGTFSESENCNKKKSKI